MLASVGTMGGEVWSRGHGRGAWLARGAESVATAAPLALKISTAARPYPHRFPRFGKSESKPPPVLIILHRYTNAPRVVLKAWANCAPHRPP